MRGDNIVLLGEINEEIERNEMKLVKINPEELSNYSDDNEYGKLQWDFEG